MIFNDIVAALFLSVVVGGLISYLWIELLYWFLNRDLASEPDANTDRIWWVPMIVGMVERGIATTLMIWTPNLLVGFIAGWMALKVAGGWGLLKEPTKRNRSTNAIGLLGSVISLGWAIGIGLYFAPESLDVLRALSK